MQHPASDSVSHPGDSWNTFDGTLVLLSIIDVLLTGSGLNLNFTQLRAMRLVRLLRLLRGLRGAFSEVRTRRYHITDQSLGHIPHTHVIGTALTALLSHIQAHNPKFLEPLTFTHPQIAILYEVVFSALFEIRIIFMLIFALVCVYGILGMQLFSGVLTRRCMRELSSCSGTYTFTQSQVPIHLTSFPTGNTLTTEYSYEFAMQSQTNASSVQCYEVYGVSHLPSPCEFV